MSTMSRLVVFIPLHIQVILLIINLPGGFRFKIDNIKFIQRGEICLKPFDIAVDYCDTSTCVAEMEFCLSQSAEIV